MSQYNDILNAVVTAVSGVGVTVEKRKRLNLALRDAKPLIVVAPGKDHLVEWAFNDGVNPLAVIDYDVWVVYVETGGGELDEDVTAFLNKRQAILSAVVTLLPVTGVVGVDINLQPAFDPLLLTAGYDFAPLLVKYRATLEL